MKRKELHIYNYPMPFYHAFAAAPLILQVLT